MNEDGSQLTDLEYYEVFISQDQGHYDWTIPSAIVDSSRTGVECPIAVLRGNGQYFATVRAVNANGDRSQPSNEFAFIVARPARDIDADEALEEAPDAMPATPQRGSEQWHPKYGW